MASKFIRGVEPNIARVTPWKVAKFIALSLALTALVLTIYVGGIFLLASAVK